YEILRALHTDSDLQGLYQRIHRVVSELMPGGVFSIAHYDSARDLIYFPYHANGGAEAPQPHRLGRGLVEHVLRVGSPVLTTREDIRELIRRGEIEPC